MRWTVALFAPLIAPLLVAAAPAPQGVPVAPGPQPKLPTPTQFLSNSIVCRNGQTGTVCQLWLEANGRYTVAFNRGAQKLVPSIDGPWQVEAREGSYVIRQTKARVEVCLTPDSGTGSFDVERQGELFAGAGCYPLQNRQLGERWTEQDSQGRSIDMWLVAGR